MPKLYPVYHFNDSMVMARVCLALHTRLHRQGRKWSLYQVARHIDKTVIHEIQDNMFHVYHFQDGSAVLTTLSRRYQQVWIQH